MSAKFVVCLFRLRFHALGVLSDHGQDLFLRSTTSSSRKKRFELLLVSGSNHIQQLLDGLTDVAQLILSPFQCGDICVVCVLGASFVVANPAVMAVSTGSWSHWRNEVGEYLQLYLLGVSSVGGKERSQSDEVYGSESRSQCRRNTW